MPRPRSRRGCGIPGSGRRQAAVNIHMYSIGDRRAVTQTVDWVRLYTGLPVISNEFGTYPQSDEAQIVDTGEGIVSSGLDGLVLYTLGGSGGEPLVNLDGSLTAAGQAWADFIGGLV